MTKLPKPLSTIGRAEHIDLLDFGVNDVIAKIDTGADLSSIWVSDVREKDGYLECSLFGKSSTHYTGETVRFAKSNYTLTRVSNSFGVKELRYKVKLRIRVEGRVIKATFTLSDRSEKTYPVLLGRRLLHNKFLVDVSGGKPLKTLEKARRQRLQAELKDLKREDT
ncbi:ATP-dependent zinc protease [Candidatus Saccharibacteria bacterium]|nr:ATP-dependent zinc protease [Candidatus Saccharibacteria bacterium]